MRLAVGREAKLQETFLELQAAKSATGKPAARSSALVARRVRREFRYQCLTNIVMVAATLISTTQMSTASLPSIAVSLPSSSLMSLFVATGGVERKTCGWSAATSAVGRGTGTLGI